MKRIEYISNQMKGRLDISSVLESFSKQIVSEIHAFQRSHSKYTKTPLIKLTNLAKEIGVDHVYVKDESKRFGLNAFKVLGGIYVVGKYIAEKLDLPFTNLRINNLLLKKVKNQTGKSTLPSPTNENKERELVGEPASLVNER